MKQIFLLGGKAESGKDSTGIFIKQKVIGSTLILHNADFLKYIAKQYMGWNGEKDERGRNLLQNLGTDRTRIELNKPLFWVERSCDIIEILKDRYDYFCICDCRFQNELYYPKARFPELVTTIKVVRKNFNNILTQEQRNHPSETSLDGYKNWDYIIESESGLDNLEKEVDKFLIKYDKKKG